MRTLLGLGSLALALFLFVFFVNWSRIEDWPEALRFAGVATLSIGVVAGFVALGLHLLGAF